jgi:hypothetical protein
MSTAQAELDTLPQEVQTLLDRVPVSYLRDLALDLAWAALIAPRRPDALRQVIYEWEITLEEIADAGEDVSDIQKARVEARTGLGLTPDELRAYLNADDASA